MGSLQEEPDMANKANFLKLSKVTGSEARSGYNDSDEDVSNRPANPGVPVIIAVDSIRCFNPRKNGAAGTRLTFKDGGGFAVHEPFDDIADSIGNIKEVR